MKSFDMPAIVGIIIAITLLIIWYYAVYSPGPQCNELCTSRKHYSGIVLNNKCQCLDIIKELELPE